MSLKLVFLLFLCSCYRSTSAQTESCNSPNNRPGNCINIRDCPELVNILQGPRPIPADKLDFIKDSQCGFIGRDPKVCCEYEEQPSPGDPTDESTGTTSSTTTTARSTGVVTRMEPPDVTNHARLSLINDESCGPVVEQKIVGGNKTGVFQYPWMALLGYRINGRTEFRCGGSIVNKRYILTAAHCVASLPPGLTLVGVRVGEHDTSTERDCDRDEDGLELACAEKYQDFQIESVHHHTAYSKSRLQDDIALLRLAGDIDFRPDSVKPICLPVGSAATFQPTKATVTGWGITEFAEASPDLLQVVLDLVPNEKCAETFKRSTVIWHKQLCAGGTKNRDSCNGDSGGPLQAPAVFDNNVKYFQYGIVSFGPKNCAIEGIPGVYTRVVYYMDWILDTLKS